MTTVRRIYVEKAAGFDVEARQLQIDLSTFLGITGLSGVRLLNRYDVEGVDEKLFLHYQNTIFSEPQIDRLHFGLPNADWILATEYLPGQYDQRADSCAQCIQMLSQGARPLVRTARVYLFDGRLSDADRRAIADYLINPIESREASQEPFDTLRQEYPDPPAVPVLEGFRALDEDGLTRFLAEYALAMDLADLTFCQSYFRSENREPTLTEIRLIDTYWSDHCRHTTFLTVVDQATIADPIVQAAYDRYRDLRQRLGRHEKPETLMDLATIGAKALKSEGRLPHLDESEEINACSVKLDITVDDHTEPWLLMFKNETHNHPTEIEPFGGAATCIGGAIRDPLSGRAYAYQAMRVTGAGDPLTPLSETLPGKLPQRRIVTAAAAGYSSYGNQIGLATGLVKELYHPGYVAKRMELGAVLAAAPASSVVRQKPQPGDLVLLLGGRTGRDGLGGATGSSKSHSLTSLETCGAEVQKGNAPEERKLQRLFRNPEAARLIKRCNDFGAGGVSVAIGELAPGVLVHLDRIPKKYEGLDGTELAISESQERMAVVLAADDCETFMRFAEAENLEATVVAEVTAEPRLAMLWRGDRIVDLARPFLDSNGAEKHIQVETAPYAATVADALPIAATAFASAAPPVPKDWRDAFRHFAGHLSVCSQQGLVERFDSTIGAATVLMPFGGRWQASPAQVMVARLPVLRGDTLACSGMAFACDAWLSEQNPFLAAYCAVVESLAKLVAAGFGLDHVHLSFQEYFEKLGKDAKRWGKPFAALLGALEAQLDYQVAAIGGKDSMSGSFEHLDVPPTLVSFAVAAGRADEIISPEWKKAGSPLLLATPAYRPDGRPEAAAQTACFRLVTELIRSGRALSAYALSPAGIAEALLQLAPGNRIGVRLSDDMAIERLFARLPGGFLLELADNLAEEEAFEPKAHGLPADDAVDLAFLGATLPEFILRRGDEGLSLDELQALSQSTLESLYPLAEKNPPIEPTPPTLSESPASAAPPFTAVPLRNAAPIALIPVFPGSNCEYDTARALEKAGAEPRILVIRNLTSADVVESVAAMDAAIRDAHMIVLPGGFSGGDEPDGSGKFITAFFRNPRIREATDDFLKRRDGLMLGICNGFQALIKLGLVPFGEVRDADSDSPTLAGNRIGRHQSRLVYTRIASTRSPWLSACAVGEVYTVPISHGEGRFVASPALLEQLAANGQIAAQYVDLNEKATAALPWNPNGSAWAVEALSSPDGRILGKMGHSERTGSYAYINVPGQKNQPLFAGGVRYFTG